MANVLTDRQKARIDQLMEKYPGITPGNVDSFYEFIERYYRLNGLFPSRREITAGCQLSSTSVCHYYITELVGCGWLNKHKKRAFTLLREPKTYYISEEKK